MGKVEVMYDLIQKWPFDVMINHNRFTLLNRQADKLFDFAKKRGIKIFNAAPFCGGILAKGTKKTNRLVERKTWCFRPWSCLDIIHQGYFIRIVSLSLFYSLISKPLNDVSSDFCG